MRSTFFSLLATALLVSASGVRSNFRVSDGTVCEGQVTNSEAFIGKDNNVKVQFATCPTDVVTKRSRIELEQRDTVVDVCGNTCTTDCFTPSGGGPNPNDCTVIADALLYDSQNIGADFTVPTGKNNTVVMQYASCLTFFVNQDSAGNELEYCRVDWAALVNYIAPNCQSTQNAHGGLCVATDGNWFVEVAHSSNSTS
ncbi:hypothetical protein HMN09_00839300 [Mycena chlorophos]|uniref:Uncharacterized protein n=2 Tax=Mycena chlorophos TaxID=658473 RepID=A0ABQ0LH17_MYCCL|nr:hypothetical protein HMN09_00839300 [Mycena chlorophos]GAT50398.1 predicted protein [Mycena chlorophos]